MWRQPHLLVGKQVVVASREIRSLEGQSNNSQLKRSSCSIPTGGHKGHSTPYVSIPGFLFWRKPPAFYEIWEFAAMFITVNLYVLSWARWIQSPYSPRLHVPFLSYLPALNMKAGLWDRLAVCVPTVCINNISCRFLRGRCRSKEEWAISSSQNINTRKDHYQNFVYVLQALTISRPLIPSSYIRRETQIIQLLIPVRSLLLYPVPWAITSNILQHFCVKFVVRNAVK
jgi:hypothetical protein